VRLRPTAKSSALRPPAPPPFDDDVTVDRPPHLPNKGKGSISSLNRPLGVPDVPTPREFGFWELLMPAGSKEFRKAKMQAIMKEFRRSNLGNIMESWRTGGKGWIAPKSIFREDVSHQSFSLSTAEPGTRGRPTDAGRRLLLLALAAPPLPARLAESALPAQPLWQHAVVWQGPRPHLQSLQGQDQHRRPGRD
jgi:hypothetical protein